MKWDTKQTRFEIYDYIQQKREIYPEIFMDARLHNYFTEDLITLKEAIDKIKEVFDDFDAHFKEWEDMHFDVYEELKKRHLSTFADGKSDIIADKQNPQEKSPVDKLWGSGKGMFKDRKEIFED